MNNKIKNEQTIDTDELWSQLVDGELSDDEVGFLLEVYAQDEQTAASWQSYHLIGDVLRSSDLALSHINLKESSCLHALREQLKDEPLVLAPVKLPRKQRAVGAKILRWPQWGGFAAASGFAVLALVTFINTQSGTVDLLNGTSGQAGVIAATQSPQNGFMNTNQQGKAWNDSNPSYALTAGTKPANERGVLPNALLTAVEKKRANNTQIANAGNNKLSQSKLSPYMTAHQQFGYGAALANASSADGYLMQAMDAK